MPRFKAVETPIARHCILRQFLTLIVQLYFSLSLTVFTFSSREKVTKSARQRTESVVCSFCSRVVLQHRSAVTNLPLQSYLPFAGCSETRSARLYKINYTRATLKQFSHNGLQTSGFYVVIQTLPVSYWELLFYAI